MRCDRWTAGENDVIIAGVDEVGRGPLAGPVVTAAVILPDRFDLPGLTDSKKLTVKKRESLALEIKAQALSWKIASASVAEIDEINILQATMLAMQRAVAGLSILPERILVDGNRCPDFGIPAEAIVGGDGLQASISAASIIAKVERDSLMSDYAKTFPHYGFEKNSGYPTVHHRAALDRVGPCEIHRTSYAPVRKAIARLKLKSSE